MSISIDYARDMIANKSRYKDSVSWKDKVARMPANQVLAIYNTMLAKGEFDKKAKSDAPYIFTTEQYKQMTLFDIGLEI